MTDVQNIILFISACVVLALSGSTIVKSLEKIGHYLRIGEFVMSFIVVGVATSVPELSIGISASIKDNAALVLGNVIGANILDVTLVVGLAVLIVGSTKIHTNQHTKRDLLYVIGLAALPLVMMWDHEISRFDGLILILVFFAYIYKIYVDGRYRTGFRHRDTTKKEFVTSAILLVASLSALLYSANIVVRSGVDLSIAFAIPPILVGLFMVSFGTTLPEFIFTLQAAKIRHGNMMTGNAIGSIVTNSALVLGVAALIRPMTANFALFLASGIFMIFATGLFLVMVERGKRLTRLEGLALVALYVFFFVFTTKFIW